MTPWYGIYSCKPIGYQYYSCIYSLIVLYMTKAPTAKTLTARDPAMANLFTTAPPGAGAGASPLTEEGEISGDSTGVDEGGEGGESAMGAVEGAFSDDVLDE